MTHGLSALNGEILGSNTWSLLVADTRQGGVGFLDSWSLKITGNTAAGGRVDPGSGGIISDRPGTGGSDSPDNEVLAALVLSGSGANHVTADVTGNLLLSGGLSGGGELLKEGGGKLTLRGNSENFSGKLTVNAGEIEIGSSNALGPGGSLALEGDRVKLSLSGGSSLANPVTLGDAATAIFEGAGLISGTISGNGQFLKEGSGKIELTGNNFYVGQTTITAGKLVVNNISGSGTGTGAISVAGTATLGGTGTIKPDGSNGISIASTGILAPGITNSIGALTVDLGTTTGVVTMSSGSIFDWQLDGSGGTPDQVNFWNYISGDLVLNTNAVNLKLTGKEAAGNYTATLFKFYSNAGTTPTASGLTSGLSIGTLVGSFSGTPTFDYGTTGEIRLNYSVVPEPTSALVGLLIAAGLLRRRRST